MYNQLTQEQFEELLNRHDVQGRSFVGNIKFMNTMYKLPVNTEPTLDALKKPNGLQESASARVKGFLRTLSDEMDEGKEILSKLEAVELGELCRHGKPEDEKLAAFHSLVLSNPEEAKKDVLVDLADWFSDMVVYIRSEAMKFGINVEDVLEVVMASNFTKLSADGVPKHDENGKFLKDMSRYVAPEGAIKTLLFGAPPFAVEEDCGSDQGQQAAMDFNKSQEA